MIDRTRTFDFFRTELELLSSNSTNRTRTEPNFSTIKRYYSNHSNNFQQFHWQKLLPKYEMVILKKLFCEFPQLKTFKKWENFEHFFLLLCICEQSDLFMKGFGSILVRSIELRGSIEPLNLIELSSSTELERFDLSLTQRHYTQTSIN